METDPEPAAMRRFTLITIVALAVLIAIAGVLVALDLAGGG